MDGCLGKSSVCALSPFVSMACPWGRNGSGWVTPTQRRVERVVFGGTLWSQNSLLLHNEQDLSIAIPYRPKQVHSTFRGASTSPWFFGWTICSSLSSSSFGVWTACSADSLVQNQLFRHWHRKPSRFTATGFLIPSSCPIAMDSWKFVLEIHWTWSELHWSLFDIGRVFFWKERGIGRFSWALQDPARNHPPGDSYGTPWDARRAYLSFFPTFVGTGLSWLYCMWMMEAIGRRWYCDSFNVGLPGPTAPAFQAVGYCDRKRVRFAVKTSGLSPQALRWTISIPYHQQHVFWLGVHGQVGVHG